jgi:hypothetical protein
MDNAVLVTASLRVLVLLECDLKCESEFTEKVGFDVLSIQAIGSEVKMETIAEFHSSCEPQLRAWVQSIQTHHVGNREIARIFLDEIIQELI